MDKLLERITITTQLGIRFWDTARDTPVGTGLLVSARPVAGGTPRMAVRSGAGVYALHGLPGLQAYEYPPGDPVPARRFTLEVADSERRFVPMALGVDLPLPYRGLFLSDAVSSPLQRNPPGFYLFSACTRRPAPDLAVVRAQLIDKDASDLAGQPQPAAHALVEVRVQDQRSWYSLSDAEGQVAVLFPYPAFLSKLGSSPPVPNPIPLSQQQWSLRIRVRYEPGALVQLPDTNLPDLGSVIAQAGGLIWPDAGGLPAAELSETLTYGKAAQLQTTNLPPDEAATLLISSGVSTP